MKKILNYVILSLLVIALSPVTVFANSVNVGVEIKGVPVINAITTISSNIIVDVESNVRYPAYLKVQNNRETAIDVYIADIEPLSSDIPSNFLDYNSEEAERLAFTAGKRETESNIAFGLQTGTIEYLSIHPNKEIKIGTVGPNYLGAGTRGTPSLELDGKEYHFYYHDKDIEGYSFYPLHVRTGNAWETSKVLNYNITMVVGLAENAYKSIYQTEKAGTLSVFSVSKEGRAFLAVEHDKLAPTVTISYNHQGMSWALEEIQVIHSEEVEYETPDGISYKVIDYIEIDQNTPYYDLTIFVMDSSDNTSETIYDIINIKESNY